jgi:putative FmdB family regulatory protein
MPFYTFTCPACGEVREELMGMNEQHFLTCECGMDMDRVWDIPSLSGDLPQTKGKFRPFYDNVTGRVMNSNREWADAKKATGRTDFEPDPQHQAARDEAVYIEKHSKPGDRDAARAAHKTLKEVHRKKAEERVDKGFEAAKEGALRKLSDMDA